jgi:hypothetical protein
MRRSAVALAVLLVAAAQLPACTRDVPPEDRPEVLVLTMVDRPAVFRANDDRVDEQICRMVGVNQVIVPPKPLARRATS